MQTVPGKGRGAGVPLPPLCGTEAAMSRHISSTKWRRLGLFTLVELIMWRVPCNLELDVDVKLALLPSLFALST
ncbi:hypothetical protein E2C01_026134 [Portunus trituberculatus]|uniref:Uncharacterized protein n=1 Tax=Portunus trituberculatus TaxID=210409 RepID=A0A5B7EJV8_PORTR|nr:hypothetical protein [Portunus trituberculatus]